MMLSALSRMRILRETGQVFGRAWKDTGTVIIAILLGLIVVTWPVLAEETNRETWESWTVERWDESVLIAYKMAKLANALHGDADLLASWAGAWPPSAATHHFAAKLSAAQAKASDVDWSALHGEMVEAYGSDVMSRILEGTAIKTHRLINTYRQGESASFFSARPPVTALSLGTVFDAAVTIDALLGVGIVATIERAVHGSAVQIVLETDGLLPPEVPIVIPKARVYVDESSAFFTDQHGRQGVLLVLRSAEEVMRSLLTTERDLVTVFLGIGISITNATLGEIAAAADARPPFSWGDTCTAGGPAIRQCFISGIHGDGCSITCEPEAYSCCYYFDDTSTACRCIEGATDGSDGVNANSCQR